MGNIKTPKGMLSYPHLFEPQTPPNGTEPVYSCSLVFDADTDITALKKAADDAAAEKFGPKWRDKNLRMPFRDDGEEKGYSPGSVFINIKSRQAPGIVDRYPGTDGLPRVIDNPEDLYPGCYVMASLRPFAYDTAGNRGVSFALQNVQKLDEGKRIDGRVNAKDEFEATESIPAGVDDLLT